jgi:hypothetical protein
VVRAKFFEGDDRLWETAGDSFLQAGLRLIRSLNLVNTANISTRNSVIVSVLVQEPGIGKWYSDAIA